MSKHIHMDNLYYIKPKPENLAATSHTKCTVPGLHIKDTLVLLVRQSRVDGLAVLQVDDALHITVL